MKHFLSIGAAVLLSSQLAWADQTLERIQARQTLVVGVSGNGSVFGRIDPASGENEGYTVDIAKEVARRLGVKLETVAVQANNRIPFLQQGKADVLIATLSDTPERRKVLSLGNVPYYATGGAALVRKDSGLAHWEDLKGKPVCISQGSNYIRPLATRYGAQVKALKSSAESLLALANQQCVASVHDGTLLAPLLRQADWQDYQVIGPQIEVADWPLAVRSGETDTLARLDAILSDLHRDGFLLATEKRWDLQPASPLLQQWHARLSATTASPSANLSATTTGKEQP